MTSPRNASTDGRGRRTYEWRTEPYWSVTTLIGGGLPKPALLPWGIKSVAEGVIKNRDVLEPMLAKCETPDACGKGEFCAACDQTIRWLKGVPYGQRDRAADIGTSVHEWIEADRLGKPMPTPPLPLVPYLDAFQQFVADLDPTYLMTEASVYNRTEKYAGTLDAIVNLKLPLRESHGMYVLDAKSGKAVYPEVALQLAAYRNAEFVGAPDGSEQDMPKTDGGLALHLTPTGYRLIEVRCDDEIFRSFLYVRECFRFANDISKGVFGEEFGNVTVKREVLA